MKNRPAHFKRPDKPLFAPVPQRDWRNAVSYQVGPAPVEVWSGTECHATPPAVARRMVELLGSVKGVKVLEPSAGTGNLARAAISAGASQDTLHLIEMHAKLADALQGLGRVECVDFLSWAATTTHRFDAIVMNPPFSRVRAHVAAARSLLSPGGTLVALVPVTFEASGCSTLEQLPAGTFETAKVRTKLVRFRE